MRSANNGFDQVTILVDQTYKQPDVNIIPFVDLLVSI